jgi:hypothetical protein
MRARLVVLALLLLAVPARADVLSDEPRAETECPPGSVVRHFSHSDPGTCVATTCTTDADCTGGAHCAPASLCVAERPAGETPGTHPIAWACGEDCPTGVECVEARRCVAHPAPPAQGAGCSRCSAGPAAGASAWPALVLAAWTSTGARRRASRDARG